MTHARWPSSHRYQTPGAFAKWVRRPLALAASAFALATALAAPAAAEPPDPVVIGWWSYFTPEGPMYQVPTNDPAYPVTKFDDPNTYYYEPSGAHGLHADPNVLPTDVAWQSLITFILSKTNGASLSPDFTIDTSSDLNALTQAYFGWALVLLYVPKDKYCDSYRIHIGSVDDGVQAMANAHILGYANLGDQNKYIDMVDVNTQALVLRPGINEVVLIHEDQAQVQRYIHNAWIEHDGVQIPLAPKDIVYGRVSDAASMKPIYESNVSISGNGFNDTFLTGPFGFYFFAGLQDGTYALTADAAGYQTGMGSGSVAMGAAATEVVTVDFPLTVGCACPSGMMCGPSGGCLLPCTQHGEFDEVCDDPTATCVNHLCVKNPCDTLTCAPGFRCELGMAGTPPVPVGNCVEIACSNVCCTAGQICSAGACVADNCGMGCPFGQTCSGGNCVDACSVLTCVKPLLCVMGVCGDPCIADPASCVPDGGLGVGGSIFGVGGGGPGAGSGGAGHGGAGSGSTGSGGGGVGAKSGCGCRIGEETDASGFGVLAVALAGAFAARRRRTVRAG